MTTEICPDPKINFTFTNDEVYVVRIYFADIFWNTTATEWQVNETGLAGELEYHYYLDLPEPSGNFLSDLWDSIWNTIKGWICGWFPSWGMCS